MDDWLNEHIKGKYLNSEMILGSFIWALKAATIAEKKYKNIFAMFAAFHTHMNHQKSI